MNEIKFYTVPGNYGKFSNFAPYPIVLDGLTWPTSEHYFQAQKIDDEAYQKKILKEPSPMKAAKFAREINVIKSNWDEIRDNIMYKAVLAKFTQHPELKELLLSTNDSILIEHTQNDSYWGDGGDGSGENMLGKILMRVRDEIKAQ